MDMEKYKRALPLKYHIAAVFVGPLILFLNSIARMMAVNTVKIFLHSNVTSIGRVLASDVAYYETTFGYKNATPFGLRTKPSKETMVGRRGVGCFIMTFITFLYFVTEPISSA